MARQVRTARGDSVDFDEILIKQMLADAPMNVEVARRKNFIDSQETTGRKKRTPSSVPELTPEELALLKSNLKPEAFENDNPGDDSLLKQPVSADPIIKNKKDK